MVLFPVDIRNNIYSTYKLFENSSIVLYKEKYRWDVNKINEKIERALFCK